MTLGRWVCLFKSPSISRTPPATKPTTMQPPERAKLFEELYSQHIAIVWKTARAFTASKEDRDDLFQEILVSLWQALPNFEARSKLSTYVYRIAHRRALNWKRTRQRYENKLALFQDELPELKIPGPDPQAQARIEWLYWSINELRPVDRTICLLYLDGISYREMADILGLSEENIGIRVHRCKQQLANLLESHHEEI